MTKRISLSVDPHEVNGELSMHDQLWVTTDASYRDN